ncbi:hypothetical protein, partial [Methylobacterium mesophilicum]|uniref:hypothetical protein n=1 Tax=Methylobacterium mesophilicum TaxID=39956 RepID=UPI001EE1827D
MGGRPGAEGRTGRPRLDRDRGRLNTVTLSVAALVAAALAGVTVTVVLNRGGAPEQPRVADAGGRVSVRVPAGW